MAKLSAHRGGPEGQLAPNALATFEAACALGVDLVEFDVQITATGEFVIGHDSPSALPLLGVLEVLKVLKGRAQAHVDLKCTRGEVEIVDLCTEVLGADGFIITTRHEDSIRRVRTARPDVVVGLSISRFTEVWPWRRLRRCGANLVAAHYRLAWLGGLPGLGVAAGAQRRGLPVLVWTLNTDALIRRAQRDAQVWAYTTDYPRRARELAGKE